jgi:biopolymer transport protein TolR
MSMRKKARQPISMPEVVLTPLIDVALTLVVILMVVAPVIRSGINLDLPSGKSVEISAQQEIVISINKKGESFLNSYPVAREDLIEEIKRLRGDQTGQPVYIHADKLISYGEIMGLLDDLKMAGIQKIGMSTRAIANAMV